MDENRTGCHTINLVSFSRKIDKPIRSGGSIDWGIGPARYVLHLLSSLVLYEYLPYLPFAHKVPLEALQEGLTVKSLEKDGTISSSLKNPLMPS